MWTAGTTTTHNERADRVMSLHRLRRIRYWIPAMLLAGSVGTIAIGCATILRGSSQDVGISSVPPGASVSIDYQPQGKTPLVAKLSRQDQHDVRIELPGYYPYEITIRRGLSTGWIIGSFIGGGGILGLAIDIVSGSLYALSPEQVAATLRKQGTSLLDDQDVIYVGVTLEPDPTWERLGALSRLADRSD